MSAVTLPLAARAVRSVATPEIVLSRPAAGEGDPVGASRASALTILCSNIDETGEAPLATSLRALGYRVYNENAAFQARSRDEGVGDAIIIVALDMGSAEKSLSIAAALDPASSVRVLLCAPVDVVRHLAWARFHDFLAVPFSVNELAERVRRLTQRPAPTTSVPQRSDVLQVGSLVLDLAGRDVFLDGRSVRLTRLEFDLLAFFVAHPRRVLRRSELLAAVWGIADSFSRTVDIHLRRLRVKIADDGLLIQTVRGVGYKLAADVRPIAATAAI